MRYGWTPANVRTQCTGGEAFTVEHALSSPSGGYVSLCNNELMDLFAEFLRQTSTNVSMEPELQRLSWDVFKGPQPLSVMAIGLTSRQVAFGLTDRKLTSSMFGFSTFQPTGAILQASIRRPNIRKTRTTENACKRREGEASRAR